MLVNSDLQVRLTGFYDAVIYWNVQREDILNFPCIPVNKKSRDVPDFQAPEVFGNPDKEVATNKMGISKQLILIHFSGL